MKAPSSAERRRPIVTAGERDVDAIATAVVAGLTATPKWLPPWLFYDDEGSRLFEAITDLPEYYLTRAERSILTDRAGEIVAAAGPAAAEIVELGAGTAVKTELVLAAAVRARGRARFVPVDISPAAVAEAVERLAARLPALEVAPLYADHHGALAALPERSRMILFIGSSLGNFDDGEATALLSAIRTRLGPEGALLLGLDRLKSPAILIPAYDDAAGVTAAFNRNLLVRLRRELGADFDVDRFRHRIRWDADRERIEMHLEALVAHDVDLGAAGAVVHFAAGETIHTESSYKYSDAHAARLLAAAGMRATHTWHDAGDAFALSLCRAI